MGEINLLDAMKSSRWEIAKGHLRSVAAIESSRLDSRDAVQRHLSVVMAIEAFIEEFEGRMLHRNMP